MKKASCGIIATELYEIRSMVNLRADLQREGIIWLWTTKIRRNLLSKRFTGKIYIVDALFTLIYVFLACTVYIATVLAVPVLCKDRTDSHARFVLFRCFLNWCSDL